MSVILTLEDISWTQGYAVWGIPLNLTNSGTDDITWIYMKIVDTSVFSLLTVKTTSVDPYQSCLNVATLNPLDFGGGSVTLSHGQTRNLNIRVGIRADAPVQIHNLTCEFQYTGY